MPSGDVGWGSSHPYPMIPTLNFLDSAIVNVFFLEGPGKIMDNISDCYVRRHKSERDLRITWVTNSHREVHYRDLEMVEPARRGFREEEKGDTREL